MSRLTQLLDRRDAGELTHNEFIEACAKDLGTSPIPTFPETDWGKRAAIDYAAMTAAIINGRMTKAEMDAVFDAARP